MGKLIVRPATAQDLATFSDMADKPTVKAWAADLDGRIIALGGIALIRGRWFAFCDLTEDARPYKMTLMRTAKRVMAEAGRQGIRFLYAEAGNHPGAVAWLNSLGFELDPRSQQLYRWKADN